MCPHTNIAASQPLIALYLPLTVRSRPGGHVLGQGVAATSARIRRMVGLSGVVVCAVICAAAPCALADQGSQPDPSELWKSYPLEQKPSTVPNNPAAAAPQQSKGQGGTLSSPRKSNGGASPALIAAVGAAAALLGLAAIARLRRRRDRAAPAPVPALPRPAPAALFPARAAPAAAAVPGRTIDPVPAAPPAADHVPVEPPAPAADDVAIEPLPPARTSPNGRAAAARRMPTCQVRWSSDGWFYAVTADQDGVEHMIASSPPVDWSEPGPPEDTPGTRWAVQRLAKDLQEREWRPLRQKGIDFDERRWYARRFRRPTEQELAAAGQDADDNGRQVAGQQGG
jgi:MYXO-CTERM domain-containing protein